MKEHSRVRSDGVLGTEGRAANRVRPEYVRINAKAYEGDIPVRHPVHLAEGRANLFRGREDAAIAAGRVDEVLTPKERALRHPCDVVRVGAAERAEDNAQQRVSGDHIAANEFSIVRMDDIELLTEPVNAQQGAVEARVQPVLKALRAKREGKP